MAELNVETHAREQWVDVSAEIARVVAENGMTDGVCVVSVPHTTAAVTIQENADPDVVRDCLMALDRMVPADQPFRHGEGNSTAHVKTVLTGSSVTVPVRNGRLIDVKLGDLDGDLRDELLVTQAKHNTIELIRWNQDKKELVRALTWPVFEQKTYAGSRYSGESQRPEPREVRIADVTHDRKPDIILLIHDRILVYPQE